MNYNEFCVLNTLKKSQGCTQREIASQNNISIGTVNNTIKALSSKGFIDASGAVSESGLAALKPYKVKNAVIMAAGIAVMLLIRDGYGCLIGMLVMAGGAFFMLVMKYRQVKCQ